MRTKMKMKTMRLVGKYGSRGHVLGESILVQICIQRSPSAITDTADGASNPTNRCGGPATATPKGPALQLNHHDRGSI